MAIKAETLISDFKEALAAGWKYVSPGGTVWAKLGTTGVDCSGLFVAAFKRHGGDMYHGSNTMARSYTIGLAKLTKSSQLQPGDVVYKWQATGCSKAAHEKDGKGNFHHVGLCVSTSPLRIIHASSVAGKVTYDSSIKNWAYCGKLKGVTYTATASETGTTKQEGTNMLYQATVTTRSAPLNVRASAAKKANIVGKIAKGKVVNVYEEQNGWGRVTYGNLQGWCSLQYLTAVEGSDSTDDDEGDDQALDNPEESELVEFATKAELDALTARVASLEKTLEGMTDAAE